MKDLVRLAILIVLAGGAVTLIGMGLAWWFDEARRMGRLIRRALGGEADAAIVARGRGAAAGFSTRSDQIVVMSRRGAEARLYRLDALEGAELVIDDAVVARVFRGEGRRPLDRIEREPDSVVLRLIFSDARNPDFDLQLWREEDVGRRQSADPADLIHEARTWLARVDALMRRGPVRRIAAPEPPPWEEEEADS
jgi:hypothetical protein